ncbi:MAG TPA: hypothetical protein VLI72_11500 [Methylibium sp.]|nr:hypothetical protein [Methylibium sp.]
MRVQTIAIHPAAPSKPAFGVACNGCGVCCLAEPCPAGQLLSLKRRGACRLLQWDEATSRYRCGLLSATGLGRRSAWLAHWLTTRARRWIAAGQGCDSDAAVEP